MFDWFKKKKAPDLSPEAKAFAERMFRPMVLAGAIAQLVREHRDAVEEGRVEYPAHRSKSPNVLTIWRDVRFEAMNKMFGFGQADIMMLADISRQAQLFTTFVDVRPHLQFPQPKGQPVEDTLQGLWQAYVHLDAVGSAVFDSATDRLALKAKGRNILSDFTSQANDLRDRWVAFERTVPDGKIGPPLEVPRTMIELLWADVTTKAKSIAVSTVFGPLQEQGMERMLGFIVKRGSQQEVEEARASLDRLRAAREPEDLHDPFSSPS
jgi:hypothetical protein